jgi:hypothetical protein
MSTASDLRDRAQRQGTMKAANRLALQLAIRAQKLKLETDRRKLETAERLVTELVRLEGDDRDQATASRETRT